LKPLHDRPRLPPGVKNPQRRRQKRFYAFTAQTGDPNKVNIDAVKPGSLGHRETFADIGQTLATYFGTSPMDYGKNML
ncbi:hypothetical protein ONQ97_26410, partial [Salmonella enterica subsp. enterica serovar Virginia]|nr:hypothetical protein [Salmonella enterica subsp. enterica serovar Virginia]